MRWLVISLVIGVFTGLVIRYDLGRDSWRGSTEIPVLVGSNDGKVMYKLQRNDVRDPYKAKLVEISFSYNKRWHAYSVREDNRATEYTVYIKYVRDQNVIKDINKYTYNVNRLTGIETTHELITHKSLIHWGVYGYYHRYRIIGADTKRKMIMFNDIYNILIGNTVVVGDDHLKLTAVERWAIDTARSSIYPYCSECSYDVVLVDNLQNGAMMYSKVTSRMREDVNAKMDDVPESYYLIFKDDKYKVFMLFGNGKWHLNNKDCEMNLVKMYSEKLELLGSK